jgi:two-component system aerobic respiration control sensor histidine kinase ArcB
LDEEGLSGQPLNVVDPNRLTLLIHDIRATVSDVIGGLRLIDRGRLEAAERQQIDGLRTTADHLARLLEDALEAVAGEGNIIKHVGAPVDLPRLFEGLLLRWKTVAYEANRGQDIRLELKVDLPRFVVLNRLSLERILSNFLANALRYSGKGTIAISADITADKALIFCVKDRGEGFSDERLKSIFSYRNLSFGEGQPGSGYGLRIARDLARRMGGTITLSNRKAGGAKAALTLPQTAWHTSNTGAQPDAILPELSGKRVLLAEDSETNQLLLSRYLIQMGATCDVVGDGAKAQAALRAGGYDLALLDIDLPVLSGLDLIREIRATESATDAPRLMVLAVSAYAMPANRDAVLEAGFDRLIPKPIIGIVDFANVLAQALNLPLTRAMRSAKPIAASLEKNNIAIGLERLLASTGADSAPELLPRLLNDLSAAHAGLERATAQTDAQAMRRHIHVIIAVAGTLAARSLQEQCEALQTRLNLDGPAGNEARVRIILSDLHSVIAYLQAETSNRNSTL